MRGEQLLEDARSEDDYTIREWAEAPGLRYVPVDGQVKPMPRLRLVTSPGQPHTEGQLRVGARPELVWLAHEDKPWRRSTA